MLDVENDCVWENSLNEAKESFEQMITSHYEEQIGYYEDMLSKFTDNN